MWTQQQLLEAAKQLLTRLDVFGKPGRVDGDELFLAALTDLKSGRQSGDGRSRIARHF